MLRSAKWVRGLRGEREVAREKGREREGDGGKEERKLKVDKESLETLHSMYYEHLTLLLLFVVVIIVVMDYDIPRKGIIEGNKYPSSLRN